MPKPTPNPAARLLRPLLILALTLALPALGQDRERDRGSDDRWTIPDDATSDNNQMLERMLQTFPDADTNKDGILDADEGRAQIERLRDEWRQRQEQRSSRRRGFNGTIHRDVSYGEHGNQKLDLYVPTGQEAAPLVVYFHGGGFITGDKGDFGTLDVRQLTGAGVAVASVNYRLARDEPFPASFDDAARALQYLRYHAEHFKLDPSRIVIHGEDAGANLALYLALHDDLAQTFTDKEREDLERDARVALAREEPPLPPIEEEEQDQQTPPPPPNWRNPGILETSTRVLGATAREPLASFDPRYWQAHNMPLYRHERKLPLYLGVQYLDPFDLPDLIELVADLSPVDLASSDDPPVLLKSEYEELEIKPDTSWTIMVRHPIQVQKIAAALKSANAPVTIAYPGLEGATRMTDEEFLMQLLKD